MFYNGRASMSQPEAVPVGPKYAEKAASTDAGDADAKHGALTNLKKSETIERIAVISPQSESDRDNASEEESEAIIITGSDAAKYLLPLRDDGDPVSTFRSFFLSTILCYLKPPCRKFTPGSQRSSKSTAHSSF